MDQFELEKAYQYVKRALDIDPKHVQALETMASVQMEMGNTDSARNISFLFEIHFSISINIIY